MKTLLHLIVLAVAAASFPSRAAEANRPNILLVLADDWGCGDAGAYGRIWIKTPSFDKLAREGLRFDNAYTPNAKCAPSRASILTGRNPWQLKEAGNHGGFFPMEFKTYPEVLDQHGYFVGMTGKGWAPGTALDAEGKPRPLTGKAFEKRKAPRPTTGIDTNDYAANFNDFLDAAPKDGPWCFWMGVREPHRDYEPGSGAAKGGKQTTDIDRLPSYWPDTPTVRNDLLDYALEVEHLDNHLGRVIDELEKRGQLDNTLIVVTSDNGRPFPREKGNLYEAANHLPFAVWWKNGIKSPGRVVRDHVSFVDLAPTILEVAGIPWDESGMADSSGISLTDIFSSGKTEAIQTGRDHLVLGQERHDVGRPHDQGYPIRSIIKDGWLYSRNFKPERWPAGNPETGYLNTDGSPTKTAILTANRAKPHDPHWLQCFGKRPAQELFDLKNDPDCVNNLAAAPDQQSRRAALEAQLLAKLKQQGDPRISGQGEVFDNYPYAGAERGLYERYLKSEKVKTGWVNPTDWEPAPLDDTASADLRALIDTGLAAGNKRIVIPQGRYRVQAESGSHLHFKDLSDVEIIAENVELVCTSTVRALLFENCTNVTLRGLTVDYDPLPFTQGKIIAMAPDKSWLDFEVAKGYPENELQERIQIYDTATGELRRGDASWDQKIEALGEHRYRVRKGGNYRFNPLKDTEQVGDILVTNNHFGKQASPHAIELQDCKKVRLEDIIVFASPCFGFLEYDCDGSEYIRCKVDRREPADDPVKRAQPRMRSLNADAFHSKDAVKGPAIIGCTARFQGDDCVNINGKYHYVSGARGRLVRIAVLNNQLKIKVGDPVEFLPYSGPRPPDAVVMAMQPDPAPITGEEKNLIQKLGLNENIRTWLLTGKAQFYTLTLDREIEIPAGSAVCCPLRLGSGFAVKDCDFGDNRSRGILIKASNGEVSGNRISNSRMHAVLVSPEFWWMEAGMSSDVVIKDNRIKGCLQTPIQIHARGGNRQILPAGALRNISIVNNRIEDCVWPLIHVTSASGITIKDNILPAAPPKQATANHAKPAEPILLENCEPRR